MKNGHWICIISIIFSTNLVTGQINTTIPDPESFFGHKPGEDFKLIHWNEITSYFHLLDAKSDRIIVEEPGKSTLGNPFLVTIISSPENLSNLPKYQEISKQLARGNISQNEADELAAEGKTIALITCSMHATECGPTQMSPELAYQLATSNSPAVKNILDNVILVLVPCWNPDGNMMVVDWYRKNLGTAFETAPMPWLYHHYTGHDNNRDAFMLRQTESRYVSDILYHKWFPQIFMDMHHMGNSDARLLLSPLYEPRHHSLDPLLTREIELTGAYMRTLLEERSMAGVIHYAKWNHWRMSAFHTCALWHNVTTILFEAADTPLATPIFQEPAVLSGAESQGLGKVGNSQTINYPNPWRGGWWRLSDIVEYSYWSCFGFLEAGANFREKFLFNMYRKARNSITKGATTAPFAYIIPNDQKDPNRAVRMINILMGNGVEVHQAKHDFTAKERPFPAGTYIILMAQPYRPYITDILGPQHYPDRRKYPGGPPERAFDLTGWTLPYQMDVDAIKSDSVFQVPIEQIQRAEYTPGRVSGSGNTFILDHKVLDSYRAVNRLLAIGAKVSWATRSFDASGKSFPRGSIIVSSAGAEINMETIAKEFHLQIEAGAEPGDLLDLKPLKMGLYQPWKADADEGWTRWIFDTWDFPYNTLHNKDIQNGELKVNYDVIVLSSIDSERILNGYQDGQVPPPYTGGIGDKGLDELRKFTEEGGTLITLGQSCHLAMKYFDIPVQDVTGEFETNGFYCPSAILKADLDNEHPITYGMDETVNIVLFRNPLLDLTSENESNQINVIARYPDHNPFMSGLLLGEQYMHNKPALIEAGYGKGKIIMFGFRPQHRAQPEGTFMLFFNSLYYGQAKANKKSISIIE